MSTQTAPVGVGTDNQVLRYGNLITLYDRAVDGHVVPSFASEAPVGVQRDHDGTRDLAYETAVFEIHPVAGGPLRPSATGSVTGAASSAVAHFGDAVRFGHSVRLVHRMRQQCLSHHTEQHAIGLKANLRVQLEENHDDPRVASRWRVVPRYRMRTEGEAVVDGDAIMLVSADDHHMLNRADRYTGESSHGYQFLEVSCGTAQQAFDIQLYDPIAARASNISGDALHFGDVVSLVHTESGMFMHADADKHRCLLRAAESAVVEKAGTHRGVAGLDDNELGADLRASAAQQLHVQSPDFIHVPLLFVIEALDPCRGGLVPTGKACQCRLKSLVTGLYLQTGTTEALQPHHTATAPAAKEELPSVVADDEPDNERSVSCAGNQLPSEWVAPFADLLNSGAPVPAHAHLQRDSLLNLGADEDGGGTRPNVLSFDASLTAQRRSAGTVFRFHSLDAHNAQYAQTRHRVLLEAVQPGCHGPGASLWLTAGESTDDVAELVEAPDTGVAAVPHTAAAAEGVTGASATEEAAPTPSAAAPGSSSPAVREEQVTIGSITALKAVSTATIAFTSQSSTSNVLEVRRLPAKAVRDVVTVRTLLQPLFDYCDEMRDGTLADTFRVREVVKNVMELRTTLRTTVPGGKDGAAASSVHGRYHFTLRGATEAALRGGPGHLEPLLDPHWQFKLFHLGVVDAIFDLVRTTLECPRIPPRLLYSEDVMEYTSTPGGDGAESAEQSERKTPSCRRGPPQRYCDFGKLLDVCLLCVAEVMRDRPELSAQRQTEADWLLPWCESVPSVLRCLATCYDGNPAFVELPMARRRLDFFLRLLIKRKAADADVLTILRLFARCGEESMMEAQEVILDFFLKSPQCVADCLCTLKLMAPSELTQRVAQNADERAREEMSSLADSTRAEPAFPPSPSAHSASHLSSPPLPNLEATLDTEALEPLARPYGLTRAQSPPASGLTPTTDLIAVVVLRNALFATLGNDGGSSILTRAMPSISTGTDMTHTVTVFGTLLHRAATALNVNGSTYYPLAGLREMRMDWPEIAEQLLPVLVAQIRLLAALASGRCERARKELVEVCIPNMLLLPAAMNELNLPSAVHAAFIELFTHTCINRAGTFKLRVDLDRISCVITDKEDDDDGDSSTAVRNSDTARRDASSWQAFLYQSPSISQDQRMAKKYALTYLSTHRIQGEMSQAKVDVFITVLRLLEALVKSGGFSLDEYGDLAHVLADTVDPAAVAKGAPTTSTTNGATAHHATTSAKHDTHARHSTRMCALGLLHTLADAATAAQALSTVTALRRGRTPSPLPQLLCFQVGADTPDRSGEDASRTCSLDATAHVLDVLQRLTTSSTSLDLRQSTISLFYRLTNFASDLVATARRVQVLTSHERVGLYRALGHLASDLEALAKKSFTRANTLARAHQGLDQLEAFEAKVINPAASSADPGSPGENTYHASVQEWLSMVHHVRLAKVLVDILLGLPVPLKGNARRLSTRVLTMLQSWVVSEDVSNTLCRSAERLAPLASHDRTVIALLRRLYLSSRAALTPSSPPPPPHEVAVPGAVADAHVVVVPESVIDQLVRCFRQLSTFEDALSFLLDLLTSAADMPGSQTFLQQQVWHALVGDRVASAMIDFSETWCDPQNGARFREQQLTAPETDASTQGFFSNPVAAHLGLCHLIYLVARDNDLVHPEEIRHEILGRCSIDMILSVLMDGILPARFRLSYLRFMEVLVLDDYAAGPEVLMHPRFTAFVHTCALDIQRYMQLCGGTLPFPEMEEDLERRESLVLPCPHLALFTSRTAHVFSSADAPPLSPSPPPEGQGRDELDTYTEVVLGAVCPALTRICVLFKDLFGEMSTRVQGQIKSALHDCLDAVADLAQFMCSDNHTREEPSWRSVTAATWSAADCRVVLDVWTAAISARLQGSARWRGEPLQAVLSTLRTRAEVSREKAATRTPHAASSPLHSGAHRTDVPMTAAAAAQSEGETGVFSPVSPFSSAHETVLDGIAPPFCKPPPLGSTTTSATLADTSANTKPTEMSISSARKPARAYGGGGGKKRVDDGGRRPDAATWQVRLSTWVASCEILSDAHTFTTSAGVVLRSGRTGSQFLYALFCVLPGLNGELVVDTLHLVRQVVVLQPGNKFDEAVALEHVRRRGSENPGAKRGGATSEADASAHDPAHGEGDLSLRMSSRQRQAALAQWPGDADLDTPMPLIALVTEFIGSSWATLREAALSTCMTLLNGGHRGTQQRYFEYVARSSHELLYCTLRDKLTAFAGELRRYRSALEHGSSPAAAAYLLPTLGDTTQCLRLLQLLCMGQFTPLQTVLAGQPNNTVSVNLLEPMVELLGEAPTVGNTVTAPFFVQLLSTVCETMLGPCVENQDHLAAQGLSDQLTLIIHAPFRIQEEEENDTTVGTSGRDYALPIPSSPCEPNHYTRAESRDDSESRNTRASSHTEDGGSSSGGSSAWTHVSGDGPTRNALTLDQWQALQGGALSTLLALVEGRREPPFMQAVVSSMDLTALVSRMDESAALYERLHGRITHKHGTRRNLSGSWGSLKRALRDHYHSDFPTDEEELRDELTVAVKIFHFLRACYDVQNLKTLSNTRRGEGTARLLFDAHANEFKDKHGRTIAQVARTSKSFSELATKAGAVEIMRGGRLERVYFRILASSQENLYRRTRDRLIDDAVRTSDNERIQFFFRRAVEIILELDVYRKLRRRIVLYVIHCCSQEVNTLSLFVILAINLTMLFTVTATTSPYRREDTSHEAWVAMHALGIVNIITEAIMFVQTFIGPAWANLLMGWERWRNAQFESATLQTLRRIAEHSQEPASVEVTWSESERYAANAAVSVRGSAKARLSLPEMIVRSAVYILSTGTFLQHFIFLFFCIMGFAHSPIWYAAQLFQVLLNSTVLQFMFRSLSVRVVSLFLTFCTLFFAVYFFSTITYYNYAQLIDPLGSGWGNGFNCYSLKNCWMVHVDTLRKGGGIGDSAQWPTFYSKDHSAYGFFAFRIVYYIVLSLVLNNLFLGVIIDGLAESRSRRLLISTDQKSKCFICGQERNVFDVVQPGAYDTHIGEEHNMWQYIYFLHYLSKKDPTTFTGQEAYVYNLVQLRDVTFFPIGKSLMLSALDKTTSSTAESTAGSTASPAPTAAAPPGGLDLSDDATRRTLQDIVGAALADELTEWRQTLQAAAGHQSVSARSRTQTHGSFSATRSGGAH